MSEADRLQGIDAFLLRQRPIAKIWVAFSGGLDSHVLLHRLTSQTQSKETPVSAVHICHGLQSAADDWVDHCESVCRQLRVPLQVERVTVSRGAGESLEEAARRSRYAALETLLRSGEVVATAHHLDDQAETLLLLLARGAGIPGLAAMSACAPLGKGRLLRPMLGLRRQQLHAYARRHGLQWVDDPSNNDQSFDRNFVRHRILPTLTNRWPAFADSVARSARHCGEAKVLLEELAALDLERIQGDSRRAALRLGPLLQLSEPRRRNLLRYWIAGMDLPMPATKHLEELFRALLQARGDRQPRLSWRGAEIRRYRDQIHAMKPLPPVPLDWRAPVALGGSVKVPGGGEVELGLGPGGPISCARLVGRRLEVGFRLPGGRLRLTPAGPRKALKKLFQETGVPPWLRERTPMLFADGEIVAVTGLWTSADFKPFADEARAVLRWQKKPPFGRLESPCE